MYQCDICQMQFSQKVESLQINGSNPEYFRRTCIVTECVTAGSSRTNVGSVRNGSSARIRYHLLPIIIALQIIANLIREDYFEINSINISYLINETTV